MILIFLTQIYLTRNLWPGDIDSRVIPRDTPLFVRPVEVIALVAELCKRREDQEPVGKALGDEELVLLLRRQDGPDILAPRRASLAQVDSHVEHLALGDPYQLGLLVDLLEVQAPQHTHLRPALVVLHELTRYAGLLEVGLVVGFHEVAALVPEDLRLDDEHPFYPCLVEYELSHVIPILFLTVCVHLLVVVLVRAAGDVFHPLPVLQVPFDRQLYAILEPGLRFPAQLVLYLPGVNAITPVMALPVHHMLYQGLGNGRIDDIMDVVDDALDNEDIGSLVMAPHIVDLARPPLGQHQVNGLAVVLHIQPVAHLHAVPVDGKRFLVQAIVDHQGNELLGELVRAVVVRAARYVQGEPVGVAVGLHEQIRGRLARRVRAVRGKRGRLGEETLRSQGPVDLVGGDLLELHPGSVGIVGYEPMLLGDVQQIQRTHHVCPGKDIGILDRTINMTLRGKVHHIIKIILDEQLLDDILVADVCLHEHMAPVIHDGREVLQVARVGELVHVNHKDVLVLLQ